MKFYIYIIFLSLVFVGFSKKQDEPDDLAQIVARGELRAVTLESATSYYMIGDNEMGFDFALAQNLADQLDVELKVVIASSLNELKQMLRDGKADFAAYKVPATRSVREEFLSTNVEVMSNLVLVQAKNRKPITNVMQLIDKDVYVQRHSQYLTRLKHLNDEIGGGINIKYLSDTLTIEEIMYEVARNKIPFTVADNDVAELGKKYIKNLHIGMPISISLPKAWIVRRNAPDLDSAINRWYSDIEKSKYLRFMTQRYLNRSNYFNNFNMFVLKGNISPYDSLFKANASIAGLDWRLLAAVAYNESRFNPNTVSPNGAMGIMQLMHRTGKRYGLNDSTFFEPADNIKAGARLIASLGKQFASVKDSAERIKYVLAAYNAGHGHIVDAMNLAKKYKDNPNIWADNVEKYLLLKSKAKYYNDPVVKLGYFRANHTVKFVKGVVVTYEKYKTQKP